MTWDAYHRRDSVLHEVMSLADARRDGTLPWAEIPGAEAAFGTPADLLSALQMRWHTRLSGAVERELTAQPWDLEQAVVHAWRATCADMPGVRAVLDAHADEPAMRRARHKELAMLATASGLTGIDDPGAARVGAEVERRARAIVVDRSAPARPVQGRGWLSRLRHALAA